MSNSEREGKPGRDISYCIDANYAKGTNTTLKSRRQLVMEEHTIAYSKSHRTNKETGEKWIDARGRIDSDANTLSCGDGCTNQSTGNYVFTKVDKDMTDIKFVGGVNPKKTWNKDDKRSLSRNYSQGERVHSPEGLSPCLSANMGGTANGSQLIVEEEDMSKIDVVAHDGSKYESNGRIYGDAGISPCIGARDFKDPKKIATIEPESEIRIRKLTPTECERLQGFPDNYTAKGINDKGEVVDISNTQRYKLCGNAISSTVPQALFPAVFGTEHIRVMSLFSGCGGTELLLPDNFEVVGHCEFDKYASSVLRYHYPDIPNFHDVTEFADRDGVPEFDLLVGGFPCFTAGTLVTTSEGLKKIEDIRKGDLVLTHTNQFKKVVIPMRKIADHYNRVRIQGVYELEVTDEHPFYVRKMSRYGKESKRVFADPKWIDCKDLEKGDFIGVPLNKNSIIPKIEGIDTSSKSFWKMIGRYLADGYSSTSNLQSRGKDEPKRRIYKTIITCGHHEFDQVDKIIKDTGYHSTNPKERTSYKFTISNKNLWEFVQNFGRGAKNKRLPGFVFDLPVELLEALIDGYLGGDGFEVKDRPRGNKNQLALVSISLELLTGFQQIIQKVYRTQPTITKSKVPSTKVIEGRTVNQNPFYTLRFYKKTPKQANYYVDGDYIWTPFKSRERFEISAPVYNFEVEGDNSYCVHNLIVHNCQSWSIAGLRKGFDDERGQLIYNVYDIIRKNKPKYLCLENVKGLLSKDKGDAFEAIMEYLSGLGYDLDFEVVNSKYFGLAQNRERVFIFGKLK